MDPTDRNDIAEDLISLFEILGEARSALLMEDPKGLRESLDILGAETAAMIRNLTRTERASR